MGFLGRQTREIMIFDMIRSDQVEESYLEQPTPVRSSVGRSVGHQPGDKNPGTIYLSIYLPTSIYLSSLRRRRRRHHPFSIIIVIIIIIYLCINFVTQVKQAVEKTESAFSEKMKEQEANERASELTKATKVANASTNTTTTAAAAASTTTNNNNNNNTPTNGNGDAAATAAKESKKSGWHLPEFHLPEWNNKTKSFQAPAPTESAAAAAVDTEEKKEKMNGTGTEVSHDQSSNNGGSSGSSSTGGRGFGGLLASPTKLNTNNNNNNNVGILNGSESGDANPRSGGSSESVGEMKTIRNNTSMVSNSMNIGAAANTSEQNVAKVTNKPNMI
jgi:hypothetical protein